MKPDLQFDALPDSALVSVVTVAKMLGLGRSTVWRKARTNPNLAPVSLGPRVTRFRVSGIRAELRGQHLG